MTAWGPQAPHFKTKFSCRLSLITISLLVKVHDRRFGFPVDVFEKGVAAMSLSRMNQEERAAYYIGLAVLRQLEHAPRDPDTVREIEAVSRWMEHWLSADEYIHVATTTGHDFAGYLAEEATLPPPSGPSEFSSDDDVPF